MTDDLYANIGNKAAPSHDFDYTSEYLNKIRGVDYIPVRKKKDYKEKPGISNCRNYATPLMRSVNKSRPTVKGKKL